MLVTCCYKYLYKPMWSTCTYMQTNVEHMYMQTNASHSNVQFAKC